MQEETPREPNYSVQVTRNPAFGTYQGIVLRDGEKIGIVPVMPGTRKRETVIVAATRYAEMDREDRQSIIPLDLDPVSRDDKEVYDLRPRNAG